MADYKFEATETDIINPTQKQDLTIKVHVPRLRDKFTTNEWQRKNHISFAEKVYGRLVISDMTDIELETVKRGLFANTDHHTEKRYGLPLNLAPWQQVAGMSELSKVDPTLTTPARLRGSGTVELSRTVQILGETMYKSNDLYYYAANMIGVRGVMLAGIQEEYQKDGQAREGHFVEVAATAQRMAGEIAEAVEPGLLAVHDVTLSTLAYALDANRNPQAVG